MQQIHFRAEITWEGVNASEFRHSCLSRNFPGSSASSQGPEGEGGLQGEPAEGSAGQPAALPQETATAEASVKKPEAEQGTPGSQDPGEAKEQKKVAEGQAPSKKGSPAFLHSPSCPAAISR